MRTILIFSINCWIQLIKYLSVVMCYSPVEILGNVDNDNIELMTINNYKLNTMSIS